jgi:hypothetical protein
MTQCRDAGDKDARIAEQAIYTNLIRKLEGLHKADNLVNVAADREIVDGDLTNDLLGVNDEETTVSNTYHWIDETVDALSATLI